MLVSRGSKFAARLVFTKIVKIVPLYVAVDHVVIVSLHVVPEQPQVAIIPVYTAAMQLVRLNITIINQHVSATFKPYTACYYDGFYINLTEFYGQLWFSF